MVNTLRELLADATTRAAAIEPRLDALAPEARAAERRARSPSFA